MWTSLGLNQGPPDYESVVLTNFLPYLWLLFHYFNGGREKRQTLLQRNVGVLYR